MEHQRSPRPGYLNDGGVSLLPFHSMAIRDRGVVSQQAENMTEEAGILSSVGERRAVWL